MERYLNQLIGDLEILIHNRQLNSGALELLKLEDDSSDDLLELSRLNVATESSFAELLEIDTNLLPPDSKLEDEQISVLFEKLSDALVVYQCYLDFPTNVEDRLKYSILRNYWNQPQTICSESINTIDFCDYDQDNCLYGLENCQCKSYEDLG